MFAIEFGRTDGHRVARLLRAYERAQAELAIARDIEAAAREHTRRLALAAQAARRAYEVARDEP